METAGTQVEYKYYIGQPIQVLIGGKPRFRTRIIDRVDGRSFYRIDWVPGGFNPVLNTVAVCEGALLADPE